MHSRTAAVDSPLGQVTPVAGLVTAVTAGSRVSVTTGNADACAGRGAERSLRPRLSSSARASATTRNRQKWACQQERQAVSRVTGPQGVSALIFGRFAKPRAVRTLHSQSPMKRALSGQDLDTGRLHAGSGRGPRSQRRRDGTAGRLERRGGAQGERAVFIWRVRPDNVLRLDRPSAKERGAP